MSEQWERLREAWFRKWSYGRDTLSAEALDELSDYVRELEEALQDMIASYEYEASMDNPSLLRARKVLGINPHTSPEASTSE